MAKFERTKDEMADLFSMQGEMRNNSIEWVNYTDDNPGPCLEIEEKAFGFLEKLLLHGQNMEDKFANTTENNIPYAPLRTRVWFRTVDLLKHAVVFIRFGIVVVVVAYFITVLFTIKHGKS